MSFMTMNMYVPHIWGFDLTQQEVAVARESGWSLADLLWEHLMETANAAWRAGDTRKSEVGFRRARFVARLHFRRTDLRRLTARINLAILERQHGRAGWANQQLKDVLRTWKDVSASAVENMDIRPRARSSLFHLRMEARHRDTYHQNMRTRIRKMCDETAETLETLARGEQTNHRHYGRWLGECPTVYDDTRKILGACLLIIDV